ncbi:MAG: DUF4154 domain-containing protein [Bacteroidia bacterium]|nr:DUF4154 domain-containing protein [Bacteroidia bacterium]
MYKRLKYIVTTFFLIYIVLPLFSQGQQYTNEEIKAAFIFNFAKYITWKNENTIKTFGIGVIGPEKMQSTFQSVCSKRKLKNDAPILIIQIDDIQNIPYTHILYVDKTHCEDLPEIIKNIKKNTLIVSDNCADEQNIMINFTDADPKKKFELNIRNILFADLEISRKIVTLGGGEEANWQELVTKIDNQLITATQKLQLQMEQIKKQQEIIDEKVRILKDKELEIKNKGAAIDSQETQIMNHEKILRYQKYGIAKQEDKIKEQMATLEKQMSSLKKQQLIIYLFSALFVVLLSLAYVIYRSYINKKRANKQLQEKNNEILLRNQEITQQKEEIEAQRDQIEIQLDKLLQQNEEINQQKEEIQVQAEHVNNLNKILLKTNTVLTASIEYAKKIQEAILPSDQLIRQYLENFFIFFRPRDIVSGDFYWFADKGDNFYIAVVDCTGHGVPGAFMSMIGNTLLNEIINEKRLSDPALILDRLNERILYALQKGLTGEEVQNDGMDITLCSIDKKMTKMQIACANHIAYLIDDMKLSIIKGDIYSIGDPLTRRKKIKFSNHEINIRYIVCIIVRISSLFSNISRSLFFSRFRRIK